MRHGLFNKRFSRVNADGLILPKNRNGTISELSDLNPFDQLGTLIGALMDTSTNLSTLVDDITSLTTVGSGATSHQEVMDIVQKWDNADGYTLVDTDDGSAYNLRIKDRASDDEPVVVVKRVYQADNSYVDTELLSVDFSQQNALLRSTVTDAGRECFEDVSGRLGAVRTVANMAREVINKGESSTQAIIEAVTARTATSPKLLSYLDAWLGETPASLDLRTMSSVLLRVLAIDDLPIDNELNRINIDNDNRIYVKPPLSIAVHGVFPLISGLVTAIASIINVAFGIAVSAISFAAQTVVNLAQRVTNTSTESVINPAASDFGYANSLRSDYYPDQATGPLQLNPNTLMVKKWLGPCCYLALRSTLINGQPIADETTGLLKLTPFLHPDRFSFDTTWPRPWSADSDDGITAHFDLNGQLYNYPSNAFATPDEIRSFTNDQMRTSLRMSLLDLYARLALVYNLFPASDDNGWTFTRVDSYGITYLRTPWCPFENIAQGLTNPLNTWKSINDEVNLLHDAQAGYFNTAAIVRAYSESSWTIYHYGEDFYTVSKPSWLMSSETDESSPYRTIPYFADNGIPFVIPPDYDGYNLTADMLALGIVLATATAATATAFKVKQKLRVASAKNASIEYDARSKLANGEITPEEYLKIAKKNRLIQSLSGSMGVDYVGNSTANSENSSVVDFPKSVEDYQSLESKIEDLESVDSITLQDLTTEIGKGTAAIIELITGEQTPST